ncbi:MAG: hypothetical protein LBH86_01405 [Oscillospiraceae bacterium]|jgi:hypothetical protein|nr:hypothetical protein [Oscillospiraceae bacterium]
MTIKDTIDELRSDLSIKMKNGILFIIAGSVSWLVMMLIWLLNKDVFMNNLFSVIVGGMVSTFAYFLSRLTKIPFSAPENHLGILGLILNLSSLFYIPFNFLLLFFVPEYLITSLATITGAHFFGYFWLYKTVWYAVFAGVIVIGVFLIKLLLPFEMIYMIPLFMFLALGVLSIILYKESKNKR